MSERMRHGASIGQPLTRRDGPAKVTGAARYSADFKPDGMLHAVMAVSTIARGRVTRLDVAAAKAHPGVSIGSYPSMTQTGFANRIVVRGKDPQALDAARADIEALVTRLRGA